MSPSPNSSSGIQGQQFSSDGATPFNAHAFLVRQMLARIATSMVVEVMSVTNDGGVAPAGFVDIMPLVNQVDGDGNAVPHTTIYGCPYSRLQGGADAVILDPKVGDKGIAVFASRDITSVIATQAQANPGSARQLDWADGMYVGGLLNGVPTQFVQFSDAGIQVTSPIAIKLDAQSIVLTAPTIALNAETSITATTPTFTVNGALVVTETVSAAQVDAPIVAVGMMLTLDGVPMGLDHEHDLTGGGHTLGVKPA